MYSIYKIIIMCNVRKRDVLQKNYFYFLEKHIFCIAKHVFVEARICNFLKLL